VSPTQTVHSFPPSIVQFSPTLPGPSCWPSVSSLKPNPRRIDASELHKLPRVEVRTTDPHDPGKEIIYSGTPLVEVLKAGGLLLDSDMAAIRETVTMTVLVEATDGYRAVFSLAELDPELIDRVVLLADTKDGQPLPRREGPFRIIVPGEKRPTRWVRQVKAVTVRKNGKTQMVLRADLPNFTVRHATGAPARISVCWLMRAE